MLVTIARRFASSWLALSLTLMALSVCASGPMTITEMVCCAEHHDDCEMAGQAEPCCAPDLRSDMGVVAAERSDTTHMASLAGQTAVTQPPHADGPSTLRMSAFVGTSAHYGDRSRPLLVNTVLLI